MIHVRCRSGRGPCTAYVASELKGYSGVKLIHGLTHRHRVRTPPPQRSSFPTASLYSFSNLRNDHMIIIHCSKRLQQETAVKKPQIILRTAASYCREALTSRLPSEVEFRSSSMKMCDCYSMEMQSKFIMCLTCQFITVIIESWQGKEWSWAFLTALGNRLVRLPHNRKLLQESGELCSLYNSNSAKLADVLAFWWRFLVGGDTAVYCYRAVISEVVKTCVVRFIKTNDKPAAVKRSYINRLMQQRCEIPFNM